MHPSLVGAPLGDSRLSSYWKVIVTIVATVLVLTLQTILYVQTAFGGWESTSASTIQLQPIEHLHVQKVVRTGPEISISSIIASTQREPIDYETYSDDMGQDDMMIYNTNDIAITEDFLLGDPADSPATKPNLRASSNDENYNSDSEVDNDENNDEDDDMIYNDTNFPTADPADFPAPKPSANPRASSNDENDNQDSDTNSQSETIHNDDTAFPNLLDSVIEAHDAMLQKLRNDYGDKYFDKVFRRELGHTESDDGPKLEMEYLPIRPFAPKDLKFDSYWNEEQKKDYETRSRAKYFQSASNLKRKMMIRILQAHLPDETSSNTYVWATGGHSAAAGHGNLFHESYTKVMEATASAVFEASGLTLEARNYAMGGTSSAPEMSMCFAEIYGNDVDIFTWDFGMLEARENLSGRFLHYAMRGFLSNSKIIPALVGLQQFQNKRVEMMEELHSAWKDDALQESNGLALFLNDASYWKTMKANIPDNAGLSDEQISQIPEFLRNFKCDGAIEKGEPYCEDTKYSKEVCPDRMGRAGWHPGWKYNALLGNAMALFVTELLVDAVREIEKRLRDTTTTMSLNELLSELSEIENGHRESMLRKLLEASDSHLPPSYKKVYWYNNTNDDWKLYPEEEKLGLESGSKVFQDRWGELDRHALFFGPSLCHTARLPAQTRFLGHLTNQPEMTGQQTIFGQETYFTGIEDKKYFEQYKLIEEKPEPHPMQLVWTKHKERQEGCGDFLAKPDYHDNFMAVHKERWTILEFPNEAEQEAYGYHRNKENYKGMIIIVPQHCGFGKCEKGYLGATEHNEGKWSMKVNGRNVETMTKIGHEAILLEHDSGIYFDPNKNGIYRLEIKVREAESFVKLSSVVLY